MEQPRFGGEAFPPLSPAVGEGKSERSNLPKMQENDPKEHLCQEKTEEAFTELLVESDIQISEIDKEYLQEKECDEFAARPNLQPESRDSYQKRVLNSEFDEEAAAELAAHDSKVQETLEVLRQLDITPNLERHRLRSERQRNAGINDTDTGVYCKNLFLKDKKGQMFLIIYDEEDKADLQVVKYHLNVQGNLHFASRASLKAVLGVEVGAVTPLALLTRTSTEPVRVFVDAALVDRVRDNDTKLYFHPLREELQVSLTFTQLQRALQHCGVSMETLPSLTKYSARRRYGDMQMSSRRQRRLAKNYSCDTEKGNVDLEDQATGGIQGKQGDLELDSLSVPNEVGSSQSMKRVHGLSECFNTTVLHQLSIKVEVSPVSKASESLPYQKIPCKCVFLSDKRDNHFLYICHRNQKLDFSSLKSQLKPKKKIEPLTGEKLWSLLKLREDFEHPFVLADVTKPRFLVAIADNLYHKQQAGLAFPHPSAEDLEVTISLHDLETFITGVGHDLTTIAVKGSLESLYTQPMSAAVTREPSWNPVQDEQLKTTRSATSSVKGLCDGNATLQQASNDNVVVKESSYELTLPIMNRTDSTIPNSGVNLFYRLTAHLRNWLIRCVQGLARFLNPLLPNQLSRMIERRSLSMGSTLPLYGSNVDYDLSNKSKLNETAKKTKEKQRKIAKLHQLIMQSEMHVELTDTPNSELQFPNDDVEHGKVYLLQRYGSLFILVLPDHEHQAKELFSQLHTEITLTLVTDSDMAEILSRAEGHDQTVSWKLDELNPLVLSDMKLQTLSDVRVGITGQFYSFPDTLLSFQLPSLGKTLIMSCEDMENLLRRQGFWIEYLP